MAESVLTRAEAHLPYPERTQAAGADARDTRTNNTGRSRSLRIPSFVAQVAALERDLGDSDTGFAARCAALREQTLRAGLTRPLTAAAFALVREAARRALGLRHYDEQVAAGWILANGCLAEMATGEGKSLAATLAAGAAGLAGTPVHMVTVNDYLASRDAATMRPLFDLLGLSIGLVTAQTSPGERRLAYRCDITYCTGKQLAFDYLRDRLTLGRDRGSLRLRLESLYKETPRLDRVLLRGLHYAIVDEADSVLVDEARTPLVISRSADEIAGARLYEYALSAARGLSEGIDFTTDAVTRSAALGKRGRERACERMPADPAPAGGVRRWEALVETALVALHLLERDRDYIVSAQTIQIVDANTGRVMPDRAWSRELQPLIELKEGCALSAGRETLARASYQRFFSRYLHLAGMTGTASEVAGEMRRTYGLDVVQVPTRLPVQRRMLGLRLFADLARRNAAIAERVDGLRSERRPVLIGTRSVSSSEQLSARLSSERIEHQVLNARNDHQEADIVARAAQPGCVTIATNMAGRGTDIVPAHEVTLAGGLHVIASELNDARRIDRQLFGRSARQGNPGSCESMLSLDDALIAAFWPRGLRRLLAKFARRRPLSGWLASIVTSLPQRALERRHAAMRREVARADLELARLLSFGGEAE